MSTGQKYEQHLTRENKANIIKVRIILYDI